MGSVRMAAAALILSGGTAEAIGLIGELKPVYREYQECVLKSRTAANGFKLLASRIGWTDLTVYEFGSGSHHSFIIQIDYRHDGRKLSTTFECDAQGMPRTRYLVIN